MAQIKLVATNSKVSDLGKFKDERKWSEWENVFTNYLSDIPGVRIFTSEILVSLLSYSA